MKRNEQARLWTNDFILIILISLTTAIAMQVLNATMTLYADSLGGSTSFSGTMATMFAVVAGLARLVSGKLTDLYSRRLFMIFGSAVFAVSVLGFGLIGLLPALLAFRGMQGLGFSAVSTAANAAAADITPKSRLGEGLGYFNLSTAIAMAIGPMIGLPLANAGQFGLLYGICAASLVLSLIFSLLSTYEKRQAAARPVTEEVEPIEPERQRGIWKVFEKKALPAAVVYMLFCISIASLISFLPLYAKEKGITTISWFYLVEAAAVFLVRLFVGRIYDRRGALPTLLPGIGVGVLAFMLFDYVGNDWTFLIPAALVGAALGSSLPVLNALAVKDVPQHRRGTASATFMFLIDIGIGLGAVIWGVVLDLTAKNYSAMFVGSAASLLLALILSLLFFRKRTTTSLSEMAAGGNQ